MGRTGEKIIQNLSTTLSQVMLLKGKGRTHGESEDVSYMMYLCRTYMYVPWAVLFLEAVSMDHTKNCHWAGQGSFVFHDLLGGCAAYEGYILLMLSV